MAVAAAAACSNGGGARAQHPRGGVKALSWGRGWGRAAADHAEAVALLGLLAAGLPARARAAG